MVSPFQLSADEVHLPAIDISQFNHFNMDAEGLVYHKAAATVREACKEWGFFRVVNHGIPANLLRNVDSALGELFGMPIEAKERYGTSRPFDSYLRVPSKSPNFESFCLNDPTNSIHDLCNELWPKGNSNLCETIGTFVLCMDDLARKILKIAIAGLGLNVETYYQSLFEKSPGYVRINHFSSHGKSIGEEALPSHQDSACLAVLLQDDKGGLQIRSKEGKWLNVRPVSDSLVVNVGDTFKAWSNSTYCSSHHRVIYGEWAERVSIAHFLEFAKDEEIMAPAELVDEEHPRRYKPFTYSYFKQQIRNEGDKSTFLDRIAGM